MFENLPKKAQDVLDWEWSQFQAYYENLAQRELNDSIITTWLSNWSDLSALLAEVYARLYVATTVDTTDEAAEASFNHYLDHIYPAAASAEQKLKEKLLMSELEPAGFEIPLRNMLAESELFCEENLPLQTQVQKLSNEYDRIVGAQSVDWEGQELTLVQLRPVFQDTDREKREAAWRLGSERQLADRDALNKLWQQLMDLRLKIAKNAGFDNFRDYQWKNFKRFDYTPQDCETFHSAIEEWIVPLARRIYDIRREQLGVDSLRPWDTDVDPLGREPLRPFSNSAELIGKTEAIFRQVDPQLGEYFATMRQEGLLDLDNRKGKAPGGYQMDFARAKRPFIFMNAVGLHDDVQTLLHEGGHAFHCFESSQLPYVQQREFSAEMAEVASMSMELLGAPYLAASQGGFYSDADAARARIEHLEGIVQFWPYMAVVDGFQQWVYTHHEAATAPANCDATWAALWDRFMQGIDYSGLDDSKMTGWHRKLHIFQIPFYYVDYGLAQLGAVQVWRNSLDDQTAAVRRYRAGLALGGTRPLPELYAATGAKFAFDSNTVREAAQLLESTLDDLMAV